MAVRDPKTGRFVKGFSGNPGGRPKGITALLDDAISDEDWQKFIKVLTKLAASGNLKAMEMLFDRRWGKPTQSIEAGDGGAVIKVTLRNSDE